MKIFLIIFGAIASAVTITTGVTYLVKYIKRRNLDQANESLGELRKRLEPVIKGDIIDIDEKINKILSLLIPKTISSAESMGVAKLVYNGVERVLNEKKDSAEPATNGDISIVDEKVNKILELLSPTSAKLPIDEGYLVEPPEEAVKEGRSLLALLEDVKRIEGDMPIRYLLAEGAAQIAVGNYEEGSELINDYLENMQTAWEKLEEKVDEELALAYKALGDAEYYKLDYNEALKFYRKALDIKPDDAELQDSAGLCSLRLALYDEAESLFDKALKIEASTVGEDTANSATYLNNIGEVLRAKGDYEGALEKYGQALEIDINYFGEDHPNVARGYNNIGSVLNAKGDYEGALEKYGRALEIFQGTFGVVHPNMAETYNNIGEVLRAKGDYEGALEKYGRALEIDMKYFGGDHPKVAVRYNNIGLVLHAKGDYEGALEKYGRALNLDIKYFGEDHPNVAIHYNNIGSVLHAKGDYEGALEKYGRALEIDMKYFGEVHPNIAATYNNIAKLFYDMGRANDGLPYIIKAFKIFYKFLGPGHPSTKNSKEGIKMHGGDPEAAEREVLEEMKKDGEKGKDSRQG